MFKHIDHHSNKLVFIRCSDRQCFSEWPSEEIRNHLAHFDFRLPALVFGSFREGHFDTFLQWIEKQDGQPTTTTKGLGSCEMCPCYAFTSKTGKERHKSMFHCRVKTVYKNQILSVLFATQALPASLL